MGSCASYALHKGTSPPSPIISERFWSEPGWSFSLEKQGCFCPAKLPLRSIARTGLLGGQHAHMDSVTS